MSKRCMTSRFFLLVLAALIALAGCERRPLYEPSEAVAINIKVNVQAIANVTTNIRNTVHIYGNTGCLWDAKLEQLDPTMMRVLVYSSYSGRLLAQSFISATDYDENGNKVFKGNLGISQGDYTMVIYNFDTPTTQVSSESSVDQIIAYTDEISSAQKAKLLNLSTKADDDYFENIAIHYEPEHLLVANEKNLRISPHDTLVTIETEASTIIDSYYLQIRVEGMQYASEATAVISGLSPSNKIGLNERTIDPSAAVYFGLEKGWDDSIKDDNKDVLCAVFNTFGKIEDITSELRVTFNVIDTAGNLLQHEVNLDEVFNSELARTRHWLIIEESTPWVIPKPAPGPGEGSGNGGFQPQVDDWDEQHGEIAL